MKDKTEKIIKDLEELAKPLQNYIKKNYDPMTYIVIEDDRIRVIRDELYIPTYKLNEDKYNAKLH